MCALLACALVSTTHRFISPTFGQIYPYCTATTGFVGERDTIDYTSFNITCASGLVPFDSGSALNKLTKVTDTEIKWDRTVNPYTVTATGFGHFITDANGGNFFPCWPEFLTPESGDRAWNQPVQDQTIVKFSPTDCRCGIIGMRKNFRVQPPNDRDCPTCLSGSPPQEFCLNGWQWKQGECEWVCPGESPIIVDLDNDGYNLTNAADGVRFDLNGTGLRQWSWTSRNSDDAFLALDRNGDGRINNGRELFGDGTRQPASKEPNGFLALAVFDENNDRWIDKNDSIYRGLMLWKDSNHDGVSQRSELLFLNVSKVEGIGLNYEESKRTDRHGNHFKYKAPLRGQGLPNWVWDVFLQRLN